ncbi:MAG: glycine oxidase ThiO [Acidobacteria bacterium]|nr:MAG: glycine oxidase ThiO [Acidobacteriota bacterium]REJ98953.1 MAG: glycine oxidase ThiO [Acidobacteriota bacterium]REK16327.1 MAG: glycine oxidase ThiO [Acidobacteriota bacterium]REK44008.1 MAG: glycine oxidase ThiO [Acidobacteriota bacterium]
MSGEHRSDVLIVGGGVIGLSVARALWNKGVRDITVLERSLPGREASFAAAGMLAPQAEADAPDDFFRFCIESNRRYSTFAAELLDETGIDIELDDEGTLYLAFTDQDLVELGRRFEWQTAAGMRVERLSASETHRLEPFASPDSLGSLFFPDDRQVENRALLRALIEFARLNGIKIETGCEVVKIDETASETSAITADEKNIQASKLVVAAGSWTSLIEGAGPGAGIPEIRPVRGQMIAFDGVKRFFRKVIYSHRGYIVPRKMGRILAGSTTEDAGFDDRITDEGIGRIRRIAIEISPSLENLRIADKWSGLRPYCSSDRPYIGVLPGRQRTFAAVGHYRNGILLAPITGEILAEKIVSGTENKYLRLFSRNSVRASVV